MKCFIISIFYYIYIETKYNNKKYNYMYMRVINIETIYNQSNKELYENANIYIDKSIKELLKLVNNYKDNDTDYSNIVEFLVVDTYNFNIYNNYINLKSLYNINMDYWQELNDKIMNSIDIMYSNKKLYNIIQDIIKTKKLGEPFKLFLHRILKSFQKKGIEKNTSKIMKITNTIDDRIKKLMINLNRTKLDIVEIKSTKSTKYNYFYLINSISNAELRKKIQNAYYEKSKDIMDHIGAIICLRHNYAKEMGYTSYFSLLNKNSEVSNAVFALLEQVAEKSNTTSEILKIKKEGLKKKIDDNDMIYYHNKFQNKKLFCPKKIIQIIFNIIENIFGLVFKPNIPNTNQNKKFGLNMDEYKCYKKNSENILGILYLDLHYDSTNKIQKTINEPLFIKLTDRFKLGKNNNHTLKVHLCIIANYKGMINYDEIVKLIKEFGNVIYHMVYESYTGLINDDSSFINFMSQLMEYIAWDDDCVKLLTKGETNETIDHILLGKHIDPFYTLRENCVNAIFDHIVHSSSEFIKTIDDIFKQKKNIKIKCNEQFVKLYKGIRNNIHNSNSSDFDCTQKFISPHVLLKLINGTQGNAHSNIISSILAYSVYQIIKTGKGIEFINKVLTSGTNSFRNMLTEFIKKNKIEPFEIYLEQVLGYKEEYETEATNYFLEKSPEYSDINKII